MEIDEHGPRGGAEGAMLRGQHMGGIDQRATAQPDVRHDLRDRAEARRPTERYRGVGPGAVMNHDGLDRQREGKRHGDGEQTTAYNPVNREPFHTWVFRESGGWNHGLVAGREGAVGVGSG